MQVKQNRNYFVLLILTFLTLGIYGIYFQYKVIKDLNIMCAEEGDESPGFFVYRLLSIVTCGFYPCDWIYKQANRMHSASYRYGYQNVQEDGGAIL